jgi:hypothetical protein
MSNYIPVCRKLRYSDSVLIERKLPAEGDLVVKEGDIVLPFTKVGKAKISKEYFKIDEKIHLGKNSKDGAFIYKGDALGKSGLFKKVIAPYNGFVATINENKYFMQEKKDSWVLAGVWGSVTKTDPKKEVVIKTQAVDVNFVAYTPRVVMGELVVFPNPSELLDLEYLEKFSNNIKGKVIYVGHTIRKKLVERSVALKVGALIGGSMDRVVYDYAKRSNMSVGLTTGFGNLQTAPYVFEFLKTISNRHVFVDGKNGLLRVPMPADNSYKEMSMSGEFSSIVEAAPGMEVLVLEKAYFGQTGRIDSVQNDILYVTLDKSGEKVEAHIPNVFALA